MRKPIILLAVLVLALVLAVGCSDNNKSKTLHLNITGLTNVGEEYDYEGWIIVNGEPVSTGTFTVNNDGVLSQANFDVDKDKLNDATKFVLTIEPMPDSDPNPSHTHILAGSFSDNMAGLTVGDESALGDNFDAATGIYILATPTNGSETNENSGIWFLSLAGGSPAQGLDLPALPSGWEYEGWAVVDGTPLTTGKFLNPDSSDLSAPYSDTMAAPPFPGEDFLLHAPAGMTFPLDLAGGTAVITIEPDPDNSTAPFGSLKPLVGAIPDDATDHTDYDMTNNADTFPTGTATR